ncbi:UDP-N-acetylglucosamine--N-acetylmuramyl-(pentapeptide) pyrophosphoryl-undecaprenol N-acetylglucosamine transferase [bacterium]|jgi:UDP-N-acetylglucosamine--N-acetylmuramyl-(pentapeptide) pyrophosphoryl-undecaprenol N-acetylglucosamine transferase|nr:UDP-N-acetylglucosamine--N-acetylmuramyl-(pentapeptide) pyrophosphoryl-undecaprenol N-acetylglucosamine transferase [bacterium]MBT6831505.1 UDP-N-acetylglucosamine--N-acetylmuramyl-(pentapeptide) pyrophosphoryl-undecaprenol N-acetylglucosamine transferase [bacterium]MBT6996059.1 UDP-N-acetylglucosamine--N-acetylmuramyl-(pentapeptide) pyrophosphoryl-undecaprenol N-acetylglucosamine transferase [bacterium]MBT7772180.1 UDP-N-acetylglucosamine--N-acetylmuramyl-(pentapeptide) pyrophosphoryl-undeca
MKSKILLVGGGTGGHIFPLRNLIDELKKRGAETELVVAEAPLDRKIVKENFGDVKTHFFRTDKIRRYFSMENLAAPIRILKSVRTAQKLLQKINPDAIFFKGGFVGFPFLIAAKLGKFRGKIFTHESDISAGVMTKFARRVANETFESFGNPQTPLFFSNAEKPAPKKEKTTPPLFKILIFGGSQGARNLNELFLKNAQSLLKNCHYIVVTGREKKLNFSHPNFEQFEMLPATELSQKIAESDFVISRAGANSLFEIVAAKKPSLIIPLPSAARDHQRKNAEFFAEKNLCHVYEQDSKASFPAAVKSAITDEKMRTALSTSQIRNAAPEIAEKILKFLEKN